MVKSYLKNRNKSIITLWLLVFLWPFSALARTPSDPGYTSQMPMWIQVNAPEAWEISVGSPKVVVAIIDTGADIWHPDLRENIWRNSQEIKDNGVDDDGNGYVDDINGWNFVENNNDVRTSVFSSSSAGDDSGAVSHGTILAGLVGAQGDNNLDGVGVNWRVKIMPLRAVNNLGIGSVEQVVAAIDYAAENGANVINFSFQGNIDIPALRASLRRAYDRGVVIVAAVGNHSLIQEGNLDRAPNYPACFDKSDYDNWILGVAAVNSFDRLSEFSNFGDCVDITAPGENIFSTERYAPQFGYAEEFAGGWSGTSFSAPVVAGAAALIKALHPEWSPQQIIDTILKNSDDISGNNLNWLGAIGSGRLNIGSAARAAAASSSIMVVEGSIFSFKNNALWRLDLAKPNQSRIIKKLSGGTITSLDSFKSDDVGPIVTLLVKESTNRLVKVINLKGSELTAFKVGGANDSSKIQTMPDRSGLVSVVLGNTTNSRAAIFSEYSWSGKKLKEVRYPGKVLAWQTSDGARVLVLASAQAGQNKWKLIKLNWDTGEEMASTKAFFGKILDLKLAKLGSGSEEQAIILYQNGAAHQQLIVDFKSGSKIADEAGLGTKLAISQDAKTQENYILAYNPRGGSFYLRSNQGQIKEMLRLNPWLGQPE